MRKAACVLSFVALVGCDGGPTALGGMPVIEAFQASSQSVLLGESVTLTWSGNNAVESVVIKALVCPKDVIDGCMAPGRAEVHVSVIAP